LIRTIEVFFKECKAYLGLGNCRSRDFDAQIATVTLAMSASLVLAYIKQGESHTSPCGTVSFID
jgi:hypothetical protein